MMFRDLRADEIDVRVASATQNGVSLLLYKDARVDQDILDETVGPMNWQRGHTRDNANCIVSIWDKEKNQWIAKEDTGVESNTQKEKGLASDSFKRSCFNWGIGRELYTAPFIWVSANALAKLEPDKGKYKCNDRFSVASINIKDKKIIGLTIRNDTTHKICFDMGSPASAAPPPSEPAHRCARCGRSIEDQRFSSGKIMAAAEIIKNSVSAYGAELCYPCCKIAAAEKNG